MQGRPSASPLPRAAGPFGGCFKLCLGPGRPERGAFLGELESPNVLRKPEGAFGEKARGRQSALGPPPDVCPAVAPRSGGVQSPSPTCPARSWTSSGGGHMLRHKLGHWAAWVPWH